MIHCYSTKSKLLSIEAMLNSYLVEYHFFKWKPNICVVEKVNGQWNVYYCEKSIESSQDICREQFMKSDFICNTIEKLISQINKLRKAADNLENKIYLNKDERESYFKDYCEYLHYYTFTNEFCFTKVEKDIMNNIDHEAVNYLLYNSRCMEESESYKAYIMLEEMKAEYRYTNQIDMKKVNDYIKKFEYLFEKSDGIECDEYVKELIYNDVSNWGVFNDDKRKAQSSYEMPQLLESDKEELMKIVELRKIRLLMRETMMLFNFRLTKAISKTLEKLFSEITSEHERAELIRNISRDDFIELEKIDVLSILKKNIKTLIYVNGEIFKPERFVGLESYDGTATMNKGMLKGRVVYGKGTIEGEIRTSHSEIIHSNGKGNKYIYVVKSLHPKDLLILGEIEAVIVDEGGILSHSSIMASELKIPCIINTRRARLMLSDGDKVSIDMDKGEITKLGVNEVCDRKTVLKKIDSDIIDKELYGNKCVNLCKYLGAYKISEGFAIDSDNISNIFDELQKDKVQVLSKDDINKIEELFPVIVRSSSIYEDTEVSTGAGLLESVIDINSINEFNEAIKTICFSSKTRAFERYIGHNGIENNKLPSVIIQRYYNFFVKGTISVAEKEVVVEYESKLSKEYKDFTLSKEEIDNKLSRNENDVLTLILKGTYDLLKNLENHLIEFGVDNRELYLLQVRNR